MGVSPGSIGAVSPDKIEGVETHEEEPKSQVDSFLEKIFGQNTEEQHEELLPEDTVWLSPNDVLRIGDCFSF